MAAIKIYQLHQYIGEWDELSSCVVGSYLHKERAEEEKKIREEKVRKHIEQAELCENCPLLDVLSGGLSKSEIESTSEKCKKHCGLFEQVIDDGILDCKNWVSGSFFGFPSFVIEEIEVEE